MDGYTPIWPPRPATWRDGCVAGIIAVFVVAFAP